MDHMIMLPQQQWPTMTRHSSLLLYQRTVPCILQTAVPVVAYELGSQQRTLIQLQLDHLTTIAWRQTHFVSAADVSSESVKKSVTMAHGSAQRPWLRWCTSITKYAVDCHSQDPRPRINHKR